MLQRSRFGWAGLAVLAVAFWCGWWSTPSAQTRVTAFLRALVGSAGCVLQSGTGAPEGAVSGTPCDVFIRTNGSAGTTLYVKETGTATNTGWGVVESGPNGITVLTDATTTTLATITLADGARAAGRLAYAIDVHDASADSDVYAGDIQWVAQRKGATVTCSVAAMGTDVVTKSHGGAALAVVMSCDVTSGTSAILKANADTALVATTFNAYWRMSRDF